MAELVSQKGISSSKKYEENLPAIRIAIQTEKFEVVDTLLSQLNELQIDLSNHNDVSLFYIASMSGTVDLLQKFVESGFSVNSPLKTIPDAWSILQNYSGFIGLHFSFKYHQLNAIRFFLNLGANIFIPDDKGITPLHILFETKKQMLQKQASLESYDQIVNMILQTHGQEDKLENNEVSHFHITCTRDKPEVIESLLQNGASINQDVGAFSAHEGFSPLHFAVKYRCVKVVKFLLEHGADVNQVCCNNMTALHLVDFPDIAKLLLQHGADLTLKDSDGNTPLHKAFEERNFELMDVLLSAHLKNNANPTNAIGISHFHIACTRNNQKVVKHFLRNGISVNTCVSTDINIEYTSYWDDIDWRGCSSLHFAAAFNMSKIVEILLSDNADVKIQDARGFTALHLACRSIHEKFEELMMNSLKNLKDANVVGPRSRTKANKFFDIQSALGSGLVCDMFKPKKKVIDWTFNRKDHIDIIKMLLKYESDVNCHDNFGNTPVFYAYVYYALDDSIFHGEYQQPARDNFLWEMLARRKLILKALLQRPVNLNTCHENGSILHFMTKEAQVSDSYSGYDELGLLKMFLKKGITVDVLNEEKLTPLYLLVQKTDRTDFIELLIQYGANVNFYEPEEHSSILHVALENIYDKEQLIFIAISRGGADPNAKQLDGTTVLHYLAGEFQYYPQIFEILIETGADINARDAKGQTPLFRSCLFWNDGLAKMLLQNGADVNIEDNEGKTVLCVMHEKLMDIAMDEMTSSLLDILLTHVAKNRATVSEKVLSSREKIIDYLNESANSE